MMLHIEPGQSAFRPPLSAICKKAKPSLEMFKGPGYPVGSTDHNM
jgi:hypothetical protein